VLNSAVGIVQELRAKRTLDALALLEREPVRVCRDRTDSGVPPDEVVVGDLVLLASPKAWKVLTKLRCGPRHATTIEQAILVLHATDAGPHPR
jgi:hypothetical protein